ncbi:MAG: hypothetical protein ACRDWE_08230 [Acidimicrobiales bacterium]
MHRKAADVAVGVAGALVVFAAVPSVLVVLVGDPLPSHWSRAALLSLHGLFALLAVVAWCSWAVCAWSLLRAVVARVRTRDTSTSSRLVDQLALRIAVAVLAISPAGIASAGVASAATRASTPAATASPARRVSPASTGDNQSTPAGGDTTTGRSDAPTRRTHHRSADPERSAVHTVSAGESLRYIARDWYDDEAPWHAIAAVNLGRTMPDGSRFLDASHLREGWELAVPALDAGSGSGAGGDEARIVRFLAPEASGRPTSGEPPPGGAPDPLPELAAIGAGSLVAALLARRSRRARLLGSLRRAEGTRSTMPDPGAVDLAAALAPFERSPLLHLVEAGLTRLSEASRGVHGPLPSVQWLRAGSAGVDVRFAAEPPAPPEPWVAPGARSWRLPPIEQAGSGDGHGVHRGPVEAAPWCPVVVPVGDDEDATWLLPIPLGTCLAVLGPLAAKLADAMRMSASSWTWSDALVVTTDPATVADTLDMTYAASAPHVLFVGDPRTLRAGARARCSVLTTESSVEAEVSVLVDRRGATVHPYGVTLRPHLLDASWIGPITGTSPPTRSPERRSPGPSPPRQSPLRHHGAPSAVARIEIAGRTGRTRAPEAPRLSAVEIGTARVPQRATGPVDVRLLVSVPTIDGLREELPPNRARRATELIAYLAVHCPNPVTGDRLRTRVLGTSDVDAAAKTLFNTAHAARRALGLGPDGVPLFPPATRAGHYRLSPLVTVDARRAEAMLDAGLEAGLDAGLDAGNREESLAQLERGLSLVDGEPLCGALTGYGWWRAEGHERQLADRVVDGACALVRGAIAAGQLDRARWALVRARRIEHYSEALTRTAMEVAAASGDASRLRAEWLDCRRQVDELDPGGMPSAPTERLYARLLAQLGVDDRDYESASVRG